MPDKTTNLILVAYPGASTAAVAGLQEMFSQTAHLQKRDGLTPISLNTVTAENLPDTPQHAVIIPPAFGNSLYLEPDVRVVNWIKSQPGSCIKASACAGAFYLGAASLLNKHRCTTHWALENKLRTCFPKAEVDTGEILIKDGSLITAGGLLSWVDLALELVAHFSSPTVMRELGRYFVVDTGRREQRYYSDFIPPADHGDNTIRQAQALIENTFSSPIRISELASTVALSERTFLRRFTRATGLTPLSYVQHLRMQSAQRSLETSSAAIEQISFSVGYENTNAFRKLFKQHTGLSPSQYRQRLKR